MSILLTGVETQIRNAIQDYTVTIKIGTGTALVEYDVDGLGFQNLIAVTAVSDQLIATLPPCKVKATLTGDAQVSIKGGEL